MTAFLVLGTILAVWAADALARLHRRPTTPCLVPEVEVAGASGARSFAGRAKNAPSRDVKPRCRRGAAKGGGH